MSKKDYFMRKRGMSTIIASILIILLVLVAVGILWSVVGNMIRNNAEQISLGKLTLNLEIEKVKIENDSGVSVNVKRNMGEGEFKKIAFIFSDGDNSERVEVESPLKELELKKFVLILQDINASEIKSISIAPVFETSSGKEFVGDVKDEFKVTKDQLPTPVCTDNCTNLGYECGTQNICSINQNCGDCTSYGPTYSCNATGRCEDNPCTDTCNTFNFECGLQTICSSSVDCGNCTLLYGPTYSCNVTGRCVDTCTDTCASLGYVCGTVCGENCLPGCDDSDVCTADSCALGVCSNTAICVADGTCCASAGCASDPDCPSSEYWETGIISWWTFDEYNSTHILDNSSYNNLAMFNNGLSTSNLEAGRKDLGIHFDGIDDSLIVTIDSEMDQSIHNDDLTVSAWIKIDDTSDSNLAFFTIETDLSNEYIIRRYDDTGKIRIWQNIAGSAEGTTSTGNYITNTNWHNVIVVIQGTQSDLYFDGSFGETFSFSSDFNSFVGTPNIYLSTYNGDDYPFDGLIDEIIVWERALNSTEISDVYNYF